MKGITPEKNSAPFFYVLPQTIFNQDLNAYKQDVLWLFSSSWCWSEPSSCRIDRLQICHQNFNSGTFSPIWFLREQCVSCSDGGIISSERLFH